MSKRTERHMAAPENGVAGEGHEGMAGGHSMSERTERHTAAPENEGHEGMPEVGTA